MITKYKICDECAGTGLMSKCCYSGDFYDILLSEKEVKKENGDIILIQNIRNKCSICNKFCKLVYCHDCWGKGSICSLCDNSGLNKKTNKKCKCCL